MDNLLHDEPSTVSAENGTVLVEGPAGIAVSLTPNAAAETSDRLLRASAQAHGQILDRDRRADDRAARTID